MGSCFSKYNINFFLFIYTFATELDEKIFVGPMGVQGEESDGTDEVRIANNELCSVGCAEWGFKGGIYKAESASAEIIFSAMTENPDDRQITWDGVAQREKEKVLYILYKIKSDIIFV